MHLTPSAPPQPRIFEGAVTTTSVPEYQSNPPYHPVPPNHAANPRPRPLPWSTGLCDCFVDCSSCCLTLWCPCVSFGRIAEIVDRGSISCALSGALYTLLMCVTGCGCLYSCFYRSKLRGQFFLEESPCADCCVHCLCEQCALCQEYRELKNRGFDLSIGWHGNMERQKRLAAAAAAAAVPAIETGMTR